LSSSDSKPALAPSATQPAYARVPGARLERSCAGAGADWLREEAAVGGVARLRARLTRRAFSKHRHDTYTVALTESGVQEFDYRGRIHRSLPGQLVILHPDELHDGRPATADGFSYRCIYLDPAAVYEVVRSERGRRACLPFVAEPVLDDPALARAVAEAFTMPRAPLEPLAATELMHRVCVALLRIARYEPGATKAQRLSQMALTRVREYLDANCTRIVAAAELEGACGESRFTINAQFKRRYGTTPYRYLLMRRLDYVRRHLSGTSTLAGLAQDAGFSDQAHLTRMFRSAIGMTPGAFAQLRRAGGAIDARR
jgi:AraC-like DNA-binding protein